MNGAPQPPGWYPDPSGAHELRFFDGQAWTEHISDSGKVADDPLRQPPPGLLRWHPPTGFAAEGATTVAPPRPLWRRAWFWVVAGLVALAFATGVITVGISAHGSSRKKSIQLPLPHSPVTVGAGSCDTTAPSCTITGILYIDAQIPLPDSRQCVGAGVDGDIRTGASVTVSDANAQTVGTGTLHDGIETNGQCAFAFTARVPNLDVYEVAVSGRAPLELTRETLQAQGWALTLAVG